MPPKPTPRAVIYPSLRLLVAALMITSMLGPGLSQASMFMVMRAMKVAKKSVGMVMAY